MKKNGIVFVVSGPSGVGKGTLCRRLLEAFPDMRFSISVTTRRPRPGEREGVDYFFVSREEFAEWLAAGRLLEWAEVYGELYGTPRTWVEEAIAAGTDVLLDVDVHGGLSVKKAIPLAALVYVVAPSMEEARRRLERRSTDDPQRIQRRMAEAKEQLNYVDKYDYLVVNDDLEDAVRVLTAIVLAERARIERLSPNVIEWIKEGCRRDDDLSFS